MSRLKDLEFLDFEASSLDATQSYPIEVGFTVGDECYSRLIAPHPSWDDWDFRAEKIHGIRLIELLRDGHEVDNVALWLNEMLGTGVVWCDGTAMDAFWLKRLFDAAGIEPTFELANIWALLDRYGLIAKYKELKREKLSASAGGHRAGFDAKMLKEILIELDVYP